MVTAAEVNPRHGHLLRHPPEAFVEDLAVRRFDRVWRRGKHLVFDLGLAGGTDLRHLVVNPMLGGRFQVANDDAAPPQTWVFRLRLDSREEFRYLDLRDMGRIYLVRDLEREVPAWAGQGPEADEITGLGLDQFRRRIRRYRDEVKDLLRNQAFLAGIGNAYSDEILFEAELLPLRRRASLKPDEEERLFEAIPVVLERSIEAILANPNYQESRQDRSFMRVHGKEGTSCPRCGHRISRLGTKRESLSFCRGCQH